MENEILDYVMETPGNTNPAILNQMLDEVSGTKLPEPTIADNGKVLGVADGAYALVSGGGGGGSAEPLICEVEYSESAATLNKKFSEIKTAYLGGAPVLLKMSGPAGYNYTPLLRLQDFGEQGGDVMFYEEYEYSTDSPDGYPAAQS